VAIAFAVYLAVDAWVAAGPRVTVYADQGHGLGIGDPLRYRGVDVGSLRAIELTEDLELVALVVQLQPEAANLCREGSEFWIVRPQMAVDSVQGLETIVGARYLSVRPGGIDGPRRYEFTALEEAPVPEVIDADGLELRLEAPSRANLASGAQVTYRGVVVGSVLRTRLASDAGSVEIDAYVRPAYRELVRSNTWFWNTGGLEVSLALAEGLSIELDSLRSLVVGGIAFATPTEAGDPVADGTVFFLHEGPHEDVREWRPALLVGDAPGAELRPERHLSRARLAYAAGRLFRRGSERVGWVVSLPRGVLGPADLLELPEGTSLDDASLVVGGLDLDPGAEVAWLGQGLALRRTIEPPAEALDPAFVRFGPEVQDCLAFVAERPAPLSISRTRLTASAEGWRLDPDFELDAAWHGALVHGSADERYVGILLVEEGGVRVAPFQAEAW